MKTIIYSIMALMVLSILFLAGVMIAYMVDGKNKIDSNILLILTAFTFLIQVIGASLILLIS